MARCRLLDVSSYLVGDFSRRMSCSGGKEARRQRGKESVRRQDQDWQFAHSASNCVKAGPRIEGMAIDILYKDHHPLRLHHRCHRCQRSGYLALAMHLTSPPFLNFSFPPARSRSSPCHRRIVRQQGPYCGI